MKKKMTKKEQKDMRMHRFEDVLAQDMKNPEFRKAWEASRPYYEMVSTLIDARNRGDITQKELARRIKTKQSAISRFESGKNKNPTLGLIRQLAQALGFEVEIKLRVK